MYTRDQIRIGLVEPVDLGTAELVPDPVRPAGWALLVDGIAQSYVDLDDPRHLEFDYIRQIAAVVDAVAPPGEPVRALHLGGGGLTLPRYVAATRPGSRQRVVERDAALAELVGRMLPLPPGTGITVELGDARDAVLTTPDNAYDLVISDVYRGAQMSLDVASAQFAAHLSRVLRPGGLCAVNVTDDDPLPFARVQAATLANAFADVCVLAEPKMLRGRRFGNVVFAAAHHVGGLPVQQFAAAAGRTGRAAAFLHAEAFDGFVAGAQALFDPGPRPSRP